MKKNILLAILVSLLLCSCAGMTAGDVMESVIEGATDAVVEGLIFN